MEWVYSQRKISQGGDKWGKSEEKKISGPAYDINKQTMVPKSKNKKGRIMPRSPHAATKWGKDEESLLYLALTEKFKYP